MLHYNPLQLQIINIKCSNGKSERGNMFSMYDWQRKSLQTRLP